MDWVFLKNKLKELYGVTEDQTMLNAYAKFETFSGQNVDIWL